MRSKRRLQFQNYCYPQLGRSSTASVVRLQCRTAHNGEGRAYIQASASRFVCASNGIERGERHAHVLSTDFAYCAGTDDGEPLRPC